MGEPILIGSGMAYQVAGSSKLHKNAVKIQDFKLKPHSGKGGGKCKAEVALVQNIAITESAITSTVTGLDDVKVIYTGGAGFGNVELTILLLTGGSEGKGQYPKKVVEQFRKKSIIQEDKPMAIKWGKHSFKAYFNQAKITGADTVKGTITVTMSGFIAPVENKG